MQKTRSPWLFCVAGTVLLFCTMGLASSSFSIYQPYLIRDIGLSNSQSSLFLTVRTLAGLGATFMAQRYIGKFGIRAGVTAAGLMSVAGFIMLALVQSFAGCCAAAILIGLGYGLGGIVSVSILIHRVFHTHMALALSICSAGTGMSVMLCPPIAARLIECYSLKISLLAEAAFILLAIGFVFAVLKGVPSGAAVKTEQKPRKRSGLDRRSLLCLVVMFLIGLPVSVGWSHLGVLYSTAGFNSSQLALIISLAGVFLTVGKIAFGECADAIGDAQTLKAACVIMLCGLGLCCLADNGSLLTAAAAMLCLGFSFPFATLGPSILSRSLLDEDGFDSSVKNQQTAYMVGALLFSPVPGILADMSGSYVPAFRLILLGSAIAGVLVFIAFHSIKKR